MKPLVLQDTAHWIALNKPAGWVINDSKTAHGNPTLQAWIRDNLTFAISQNDEFRNGIVHRLDKETSGVILVAKDEETFYTLQRQFQDRVVKKMYHTLVHGRLESGGKINLPIKRNPRNRTRFTTDADGRESTTEFEFFKLHKRNNEYYSELFVYPKTGRTHQIRVHMQAIHHPIVSDPLYSGRKVVIDDLTWCPRMFLHAQKLWFINPLNQAHVEIEATLPEDLLQALSFMK